jgi:hypothetical protein
MSNCLGGKSFSKMQATWHWSGGTEIMWLIKTAFEEHYRINSSRRRGQQPSLNF